MSFSTSFGSLVGGKLRKADLMAKPPQADYDAALRAAQNPRDRALRLAREARFAGMRTAEKEFSR